MKEMTCFKKNSWKIFILLVMGLPFVFSCTSTRIIIEQPGGNSAYRIHKIEKLPAEVRETSGLEYFNGRFWTFNDSGGDGKLFGFVPGNPGLDLQSFDTGQPNYDWEDIAFDGEFVYIGDFGNNFGTRDTMFIYKIRKESIGDKEVSAEVISFSFRDKTAAFSNCGLNPFDCEAMTVRGDSLYLFSKNWQDRTSRRYRLPKEPGYYSLKPGERFFPGILITGADYSEKDDRIWLSGYRRFLPVILCYNPENFCNGKEIEIILRGHRGLQVEAVYSDSLQNIWFTNERSITGPSLWMLEEKQR